MLKFIQNYFYKRSIKKLKKDITKDFQILIEEENFEYMFTNQFTHIKVTETIEDLKCLYQKCINSIETFPNSIAYNKLNKQQKQNFKNQIIYTQLMNNKFKHLCINKYNQLVRQSMKKYIDYN